MITPNYTYRESPYYLSFEIPGLPNRPNQVNAKGYWSRYKESEAWHELVAMTVGRRKPKAPLKKAKLILTRYSSVCPDPDGLVGSFKYVVDGLVKCGVLTGDKLTQIGMPDYRWEKVKPKQGKISAVIEEIEP